MIASIMTHACVSQLKDIGR